MHNLKKVFTLDSYDKIEFGVGLQIWLSVIMKQVNWAKIIVFSYFVLQQYSYLVFQCTLCSATSLKTMACLVQFARI